MKKVYQTTFGKMGNCYSACCASLFEEPIEEWDCVANWRKDWRENLSTKLKEKGLSDLEVTFSDKVQSVTVLPNHKYILGVISSNGLPHVVIGEYVGLNELGSLKFQIIHDPLGDHYLEEGYKTVDSLIVFYKTFP